MPIRYANLDEQVTRLCINHRKTGRAALGVLQARYSGKL